MGKAYRVRLAESSLEKAARLLTDDHKLKVIFRGNTAITNGDVIVLPAVPADAEDSHVEIMTGVLFHEAGHKLFSDFDIQEPDTSRFACINAVEDSRMEARLLDIYPGAITCLNTTRDFYEGLIFKNWAKATQLQRVLAGYTFAQARGKTGFYDKIDPVTRNWVDQALECTGPCQDLAKEDVLPVGQKLADLLSPLFEEHEENAQDSTDINESVSYGLQQNQEISEQLAQELKEGDEEQPSEDQESGALVTELKNLNSDGTYRVYSTEHDLIEKIPDQANEEGVKVWALREAMSEAIVTMRRKLLNTLRIMTEAKWSRGHDEGELDSDVLWEVPYRLNDLVFKQRKKQMELNVALALAIDHSGSMGTEKMLLATQAALALGDVVEPLKIPFLVYGFSTVEKTAEGVPGDVAKTYARWNGLWIGIYHDFNKSWREGALRLASAVNNKRKNTLDGESVLYGLRRLLARKEKRKILFVLTDGQPEPGLGVRDRCADHLKAVVKLAGSVGVEVVAFGIQSSTVSIFYPNHVVLRSLADIVKEPLTKLDDALRKGRRFV